MAKDLNLQFTNEGENNVTVSWTDLDLPEFHRGQSNLFGGVVGVGAIVFVLMGIGNLWFLLVAIVWTVGGIIMFKSTNAKPNSVTFSPESVTVKGRQYPTDQVTRFEYGLRSQLTGQVPQQNQHGPMADPMLIRMWINDSSSVEVSLNNWQNQVNHEIRSALDETLIAVRKKLSEEKQEAVHGKTGDFGMPEY